MRKKYGTSASSQHSFQDLVCSVAISTVSPLQGLWLYSSLVQHDGKISKLRFFISHLQSLFRSCLLWGSWGSSVVDGKPGKAPKVQDPIYIVLFLPPTLYKQLASMLLCWQSYASLQQPKSRLGLYCVKQRMCVWYVVEFCIVSIYLQYKRSQQLISASDIWAREVGLGRQQGIENHLEFMKHVHLGCFLIKRIRSETSNC